MSNGHPITTRDVLQRAYPRLKHYKRWQRWSVWRVLLSDAVLIARSRFGKGRPNLWLPNYEIGTKQDKT